MPWMVPLHKADPEQKEFLRQFTLRQGSNYWIKGFAGTGKTVLLVWALQQAKTSSPDLSVCVVLYTRSLIDLVQTGIPDSLRGVPVITYLEFQKNPQFHDLILVDEVQDLPAATLRLLKSSCRQLLVAGDELQSIYDDTATPAQIQEIAGATLFPLGIMHRLTSRIIEIATAFCQDHRLHEAKRGKLANVDVKLAVADDEDDEVQYVWDEASEATEQGYSTAILLPNSELIVRFCNQVLKLGGNSRWREVQNRFRRPDLGDLNNHLRACDLRLQYLGGGYGSLKESEEENLATVMTYHSAKGLDFENVFLPMLNDRLSIWRDDESRAQALFFVALTRSRMNLILTYTGRPHPYVATMPAHLLHKVSLPQDVADDESGSGDDDPLF